MLILSALNRKLKKKKVILCIAPDLCNTPVIITLVVLVCLLTFLHLSDDGAMILSCFLTKYG